MLAVAISVVLIVCLAHVFEGFNSQWYCHGGRRCLLLYMLFAVPETALGLFPDVGSSYYLSRSPGFFDFSSHSSNSSPTVVLRPGMRYVHQLAIRIMLLKPVKQETNFIEMNLDKTWMVEAW
ncbi:uncharacterized protein [Primulina eburnea]|uniref:uncharacterized protein isoform X6 n=1 Tax=Primulina eburnea TaxID=1245227 RepID=UPI003C6BF829